MDAECRKRIEAASEWLHEAKHVVFFTGAGISTESGLPDFRGPDGVWTRRDRGLPPRPVDWDAVEPNRAHRALVALQEMGKLAFLISQNVDNLHLASGIDPERIAELHGNRMGLKCMECDARFSKETVGWDPREHGKGYRTDPPHRGAPACSACGGRLISSVVNFGDPMPEKEMALAFAHSKACDLFFVVGSSLVVVPAALMPKIARQAGARLILLNQGDTPYDRSVELRFRESAGDVLPAIVEEVRRLMEDEGT
ncbi:MAG: SIR2 family NAD-dependent protein deacylase [Planctomycetota bacterium]|jgi:NAD-dependent SIR2 family protein deacetylase